MGIDLVRSMTFVAKDPKFASKLGIGGAAMLVPFMNLAGLGYAVNMFRNILEGRDDGDVLPEWEDFGDHFFKGLSAFVALLCYAAAFGILYMVVSIPLFFMMFGAREAGLSLGGTLLMSLLAFLFFAAFSFLALMATALYAETLELVSAFTVGELFVRVRAAGTDYLKVVGFWLAGILVARAVTWFIPFVGTYLFVALMFPLLVMVFHALAHLTRYHFQPEVHDPLAWTPGAPAAQARPGGKKASDLIDKPSETVLTWSTDSDAPED